MRTRVTPNTDTLREVNMTDLSGEFTFFSYMLIRMVDAQNSYLHIQDSHSQQFWIVSGSSIELLNYSSPVAVTYSKIF